MPFPSAPNPQRADLGRLLLRLASGGFLLPHGLGKLFGWFGGPGMAGFTDELHSFGLPAAAPLPLLLATMQALAGLCVAIGLYTRVSAVLAAGFLAVTIVLNLAHGWFWMHGGIEYPLMWMAALVAVALLGAGSLSMDARRLRPRRVHLPVPARPRP